MNKNYNKLVFETFVRKYSLKKKKIEKNEMTVLYIRNDSFQKKKKFLDLVSKLF